MTNEQFLELTGLSREAVDLRLIEWWVERTCLSWIKDRIHSPSQSLDTIALITDAMTIEEHRNFTVRAMWLALVKEINLATFPQWKRFIMGGQQVILLSEHQKIMKLNASTLTVAATLALNLGKIE